MPAHAVREVDQRAGGIPAIRSQHGQLRLFLVKLILNLPHEFFDHILQRDHAEVVAGAVGQWRRGLSALFEFANEGVTVAGFDEDAPGGHHRIGDRHPC